MKISREQYNKLPNQYKKYFIEQEDLGGVRKNIHPS